MAKIVADSPDSGAQAPGDLETDARPSTILITGAGGGVGARLSDLLLTAGYSRLVFHHRQRSEQLAELLSSHHVDPARAMVTADLTDEDQVRRMHAEITERYGPLYGLINLAGASGNGMSWKLTTAEFQRIINANLVTTFQCCREFIPEMREQGRGRIVNISSVVGFTGVAGAAHYCAAKAAVVGLTKALALELAPKRVTASVIALGYFDVGLIDTVPPDDQARIRARIPASRFGEVGEIAGLVRYLLGSAGAYASGQVYHLNGGLYG